MEVNENFLTSHECQILAQGMEQKYATFLDDRTFRITAEKKSDGVYVTTLLSKSDSSFYYPVESRIDYVKNDLIPRKAALFLIDYIDVYFEEYLEQQESTLLFIDWKDQQYEANEFQIKGQILNKKVEDMAEAILSKGEKYEGPDLIV